MNIIIGPPGTGKTTKLLSLVEREISSGIDSKEIGYFAFTTRAANEAKERAYTLFDFNADDLPYFRTLHSLAFHQLGMSRSQVFNEAQRKDFGDLMGLEVTGKSSFEEGSFAFSKKGDQILGMIEVARVKGVSVRQQWGQADSDIGWFEIERVERGLTEFKKARNLYDFTDMLSLFLSEQAMPLLKTIFIDEAQDLSFLQWQIVFSLEKLCENMYVAGDDDQAIFKWAGAEVDNFLSLSGEIDVLQQSYRVPQHAHYLAGTLIKRVSKRREKHWNPRPDSGTLSWHSDIEHIDMSEGEWLILARNNYLLNQAEQQCRLEGFFYQRANYKGINDTLLAAILNWEQLRKGGTVTAAQVKQIYKHMTPNKGVAKEHKYPEYIQDSDRADEDKALYQLDFRGAVNLCKTARFMTDFSVIQGDGGGTQYTFLEAIDAGTICLLHREWIKPKDAMVDEGPNQNCLSFKNWKAVTKLLNGTMQNGMPTFIRANAVKLLQKHNAVDIAAKYMRKV